MIKLHLDWREVLWWMQGGMAGSHLRWSVYEDMVNRVWPQCSEQERRNIWLIMRRDLGTCWRPDGWRDFNLATAHGEGPWKADDDGYAIDIEDAGCNPCKVITDLTPWMYFRQVLARFDPENQYAVTMRCRTSKDYQSFVRLANFPAVCIKQPYNLPKADDWESDTCEITVRTYRWRDEYRIDWGRRCAEDAILKTEKLTIPDERTM